MTALLLHACMMPACDISNEPATRQAARIKLVVNFLDGDAGALKRFPGGSEPDS